MTLDGRQYIARTRLFTKSASGLVVAAEPGESCERVTPSSLAWLLEQGHIERRVDDPAPAGDKAEA
jgi:hypothetical protein